MNTWQLIYELEEMLEDEPSPFRGEIIAEAIRQLKAAAERQAGEAFGT